MLVTFFYPGLLCSCVWPLTENPINLLEYKAMRRQQEEGPVFFSSPPITNPAGDWQHSSFSPSLLPSIPPSVCQSCSSFVLLRPPTQGVSVRSGCLSVMREPAHPLKASRCYRGVTKFNAHLGSCFNNFWPLFILDLITLYSQGELLRSGESDDKNKSGKSRNPSCNLQISQKYLDKKQRYIFNSRLLPIFHRQSFLILTWR